MNNGNTFHAGLMWFRRDLRLDDNPALHRALSHCARVYCVFVLDRDILDPLPRADRRVEFIREALVELDARLRTLAAQAGASSGLIVLHGSARRDLPALARKLGVQAVFAAHDYEPDACARDAAVRGALADAGISLDTCKDHVIFERQELLTQTGKPFVVFTPYMNAWRRKLDAQDLQAHDVQPLAHALQAPPPELDHAVPGLSDFDFLPTNLKQLAIGLGESGGQAQFTEFLPRLHRYNLTRDYPAQKGPSYLGVHLRFGTVSIRRMVAAAMPQAAAGSQGASVWLSELIWRDFYAQILANHPHVITGSFRPEYDAIRWEHGKRAQSLYAAWCEARTGYPLVDAAMLQLNQTGYMHNRLRMIAASFLVKDLGIDWRWGERYFAEKLNDFELASNNGGWQWCSSSGCDAQPWFRIFNPVTQSEKFDVDGRFIKRYLPVLSGLNGPALHAPWKASDIEWAAAGMASGRQYPLPLVLHEEARTATLARYSAVKKVARA